METVANCVIPYVHQRDRNSVSLVCSRWYEIDRMTRKHITVHLHYAPTPLCLSRRFPFLESLTLKGYPSRMKLLHKSHVNITPWIQEISASFKCLKSLHIRNVSIHDSDLELLAKGRGKDLKVLKIVDCEGISENGLMHISKDCNELRTLCLDFKVLDGEEGCVKWLQELALRNVGIETFSFGYNYFCNRLDVKDVALLVKNCSKSLVSLEVITSYIDDLADAFSNAVKVDHFSNALYRKDMDYSSFKFPSTIRCLGLCGFPETSLQFICPLLNQLRELDITCIDVKADFYCFFIQKCANLEVLATKDVCGDKGLQVISQYCKKLRKFTLNGCLGTHVGLISLALGCRNLEYLSIRLKDISNKALECIGTNLKNLRALYFRVRKNKNDIETDLAIDDGIQAILIGCTRLERLSIDLDGGILTDVGWGFIGKYGINLRFLSLPYIGRSVEGLRALSTGCPRLRKLELERCDFCDQDIASFWFNVPSLRYIWVLDKDYETVLALTRPEFNTREAQVRTELKPYLTLAKNLDRLAGKLIAGGCGLKSVNVTYASARVPDDLATQLLSDMVSKGINISEEHVIMDKPLNTSHEIIQVKIADVESGFVGAISESKDLTVEGTLKNGVPYLTKVGAFETDVSLEGNIILCRQVDQPGIIGSVGTILGEEKLNVSFMSVGKTERKEAVMAIVVDKKPRLNTLKKIGESRGVKEVVFLAL